MAGRGPLPNPQHRHRGAPSIPTTQLPATGRSGPLPKVPIGYRLGRPGRAWWKWAWSLPQACAWSDGDLYVVARRASLEDDLMAVEKAPELPDLSTLCGETVQDLKRMFGRISALASGRVAIMREIRELDSRLGLTPKALAELRWSIVAVEPEAPAAEVSGSRRLRAVDAIA